MIEFSGSSCALLPEEDAIGDPDDDEDGQDDTLPADLWYACGVRTGFVP